MGRKQKSIQRDYRVDRSEEGRERKLSQYVKVKDERYKRIKKE